MIDFVVALLPLRSLIPCTLKLKQKFRLLVSSFRAIVEATCISFLARFKISAFRQLKEIPTVADSTVGGVCCYKKIKSEVFSTEFLGRYHREFEEKVVKVHKKNIFSLLLELITKLISTQQIKHVYRGLSTAGRLLKKLSTSIDKI